MNAPDRAEIIPARMSVEQRASAVDRVLAARERYVARGVSTPTLVVARAEGARVWDVDGREFLDFAGGIACQNLGHGPSAVVAAVHEQVGLEEHVRELVEVRIALALSADLADQPQPRLGVARLVLHHRGVVEARLGVGRRRE